jgi:hypothetical protein
MTTTLFPASSLRECPRPQAGSEREVVARLISNVAGDGVRVDPAWIVNCYVAFKSTPLTILAGPEQCGKALMVHNLAQMLTQDVLRNQMMLGHAWWAEGNQAAALFMEAQTRWNASKVLALMEEASLPENSGYIFIGWLNRISPAELAGYLSELAFQLQHQRLVRPPSLHLAEPIACPPNFSLLGTMDTRPIYGLDETLLSETTIIPWPALEMGPAAGRQPAGPPIPDAE